MQEQHSIKFNTIQEFKIMHFGKLAIKWYCLRLKNVSIKKKKLKAFRSQESGNPQEQSVEMSKGRASAGLIS